MEGTPSKTQCEQERCNSSEITGYGTIHIEELDAMLETSIPWDDIDQILISYYPKFASNRQVSKLADYIESKFGVRITRSHLSKRYERLKDSGDTSA